MKRAQLTYIRVGQFMISQAHPEFVKHSGKPLVAIYKNDGEGGTFDAEKFEKVIEKFFQKEF